MAEQWIKWEPTSGLAENYDLDSISYSIDGLKIVFSGVKNIQMFFKDSVLAYRKTDESFRLKTLYDFIDDYDKKLYGDWTFFKIGNSSYISWLSEQSHEKIDLLHCTHFCLFTADDCIDVLATGEPLVEFIEKI